MPESQMAKFVRHDAFEVMAKTPRLPEVLPKAA